MRIIALDIGDKTIGIAASDLLGITAQGIEVIRRTSLEKDLARLDELVKEYEAASLVVGFPKNMNGSVGPRAEAIQEFAGMLQDRYPSLKVVLWDERLSTAGAQRSLLEADLSRAKRRQVIDKMAAVYILQGYMDSLPRQNLP